MTPTDPGFDQILYSAPPPGIKANDDDQLIYVVGIDGIPRAISDDKLDDYLFGGEYDEMMEIYDEEISEEEELLEGFQLV